MYCYCYGCHLYAFVHFGCRGRAACSAIRLVNFRFAYAMRAELNDNLVCVRVNAYTHTHTQLNQFEGMHAIHDMRVRCECAYRKVLPSAPSSSSS